MRKWLALVLLLPVFLGSLGFRLSTHFCCGEPVAFETKFASETGGSQEEESVPGGCCSDETLVLTTSPGELCQSSYSLPPPVWSSILPHPLPNLPDPAIQEKPSISHFSGHPDPPPRSRPLWLSCQNLRI